jgi:hypothetical protein
MATPFFCQPPKPRPREPTRTDHIVAQHGGSTIATELLPTQLDKAKQKGEHAVGVKELWQMIGQLQAENKWLRELNYSLSRYRERESLAFKEKEQALRELEVALESADRSFLELLDIVPDLVGDEMMDRV